MLYQSLSGGHLRILHRCHQMIWTFDRVMHKEFVIGVKRDLKRCQKFRTIWSLETSKKIFLHMLFTLWPPEIRTKFQRRPWRFQGLFFTHQIVRMTRSDKPRSCLFGIRHVLFGPFSGLTFSQLQGKGCKGSSKDNGIRTSLWVTK